MENLTIELLQHIKINLSPDAKCKAKLRIKKNNKENSTMCSASTGNKQYECGGACVFLLNQFYVSVSHSVMLKILRFEENKI